MKRSPVFGDLVFDVRILVIQDNPVIFRSDFPGSYQRFCDLGDLEDQSAQVTIFSEKLNFLLTFISDDSSVGRPIFSQP